MEAKAEDDEVVVPDAEPVDDVVSHGIVRKGVCYVRRYYGPQKETPERQGVHEHDEPEMIGVRHFPLGTAPTRLSVTMAASVRMAEYETTKIDVLVSIPCYQEELGDAYEWVKEFAGTKVSESVTRLRALRDKLNGGGK